MPPSRSGIADYAAAMYLDEAEFPDLKFVVEKDAERSGSALSPADASDDRKLLQVGNNVHHGYIYEEAQKAGAIIEFHDLSLHHIHTETTLARGDFDAYRAGLEASNGEWGRRFAFQRRKGYYTPNLEFHSRVNQAVAENADAIIVHSQWARMQLELQECKTPIYVVPHFARRVEESAATASTREEARATLGLDPDDFIILAAGYVTRAKRLDWTLDAFEQAASEDPRLRLIVAGSCDDQAFRNRVESSPVSSQIEITGYVADPRFCDLTLAADLLPVMRFPSAGESSGIVARALGFGRLCLVPELMAFSDLPDTFVEKIHLDQDPIEQLQAAFRRWRCDPDGLRAKEADIAAYARESLSLTDLRKDVAEILRWHWT
ncbi:MAG: glycosyltransferase [Pseudomonadota bacterium]